MLTQRKLASHLIEDRKAHYHFTAKGNQKGLLEDISAYFENRGRPDFAEPTTLAHGRIESRKIWTTTALNDYINFPYVRQTFVIERHAIQKWHYIIDHVYDEDCSQIRTGHGSENMSGLRRFAVGLLKSRDVKNISKKIRQMTSRTRMVFDYLRMIKKYAGGWG